MVFKQVEKNADEKEIKKAYRKLAVKHQYVLVIYTYLFHVLF